MTIPMNAIARARYVWGGAKALRHSVLAHVERARFTCVKAARHVACVGALIGATLTLAQPGAAQEDCDAACQAARKAQDPLAPVTALLTDNTISYGPNSNSTSYNYQLQPVYTFEGDQANVILRGLIPYIGVPDGAGGTDYGFSDTILQVFYVPEVEPGAFKLGYGAQISFDTAETGFGGPGNGAGIALVGFGFAGDLSYGGVLGHLWGENSFSVTTIQPIAFYNLETFLGGSYIGYSNTLSYNWDTEDWTIPIGATFGKTFLVGNGHAIDFNVGAYHLADAPGPSDDWQFKFGVSWFLP